MITALARLAPKGSPTTLYQNAQSLFRLASSSSFAPVRYMATPTTTGKSEVNPVPPAKAGNDDEVPSIFDQATGLERAEIEYPDLFKHNEVLRGEFGTKENPVKIQSFYDHRIVGCTGRPAPDDHDVAWLIVEKGKLTQCEECGQYFTLDPR